MEGSRGWWLLWGFLLGCRGTNTSDRTDTARTGGEDQGTPQSLLLGSEVREQNRGKAPCCVPGAVLGAGDG